MALSALAPIALDLATPSQLPIAPGANGDMDIDMDIDLGPMEEVMVSDADTAQPFAGSGRLFNPLTAPSLSDSNEPIPYKVHIRGLDQLRTSDIHKFSIENFPSHPPVRVEWIDDTSANIVYATAEIATEALLSFVRPGGELLTSMDLHLLPAKSASTHPDAQLQVRMAVASDRKQPGARERSRFYLFNPQEDPGERRRRDYRNRGRRGVGMSDRDSGDYRRRRYSDDEQRRRRETDHDMGFAASLYDDDSFALERRNGLFTPHGAPRRTQDRGRRSSVRFSIDASRDLFPERRGGDRERLRDRSASPQRDSSQDMQIDTDGDQPRRRFRERSPYPSPPRQRNRGKELLPERVEIKDISADLRGTALSTTDKKELFPAKRNTSHHRRSDAFDAADETADLFAVRMSVPFTDGAAASPPSMRNSAQKARKAAGVLASQDDGRLKDPDAEESMESDPAEFSIRGAAKQQQDQGFSIRGVASSTAPGRELFPGKIGLNAGKELFAEKLEGRGRRRRKAEDMFN